MVNSDFTIVFDTREKNPYLYPNSSTRFLPTGDYSIFGLEDKIAIERKTKQDAYQSLGRNRKRFENEFKRLSEMKYAAVVIECSLHDFLIPPKYTKMKAQAAISTIISWQIKYDVHITFAGDREHSMAYVYKLLQKFYKYYSE